MLAGQGLNLNDEEAMECADGPQRHPLLGTRALVVVPLDGQASWVNPCVETLPAFSWSLC